MLENLINLYITEVDIGVTSFGSWKSLSLFNKEKNLPYNPTQLQINWRYNFGDIKVLNVLAYKTTQS